MWKATAKMYFMRRKWTKPFPENEKALVANREKFDFREGKSDSRTNNNNRETTEQGLKQTVTEIFNVTEIWTRLINGALFSVFATTPS